MSRSFNDLPLDASQDSIFGQTGRMFEEQVNGDPSTDYSQEGAFNTAIWYLAEKALRRAFFALRGMTTAQVAYAMSSQIKSFLRAEKAGGQQRSLSYRSSTGFHSPRTGLSDGEKYPASQQSSIYTAALRRQHEEAGRAYAARQPSIYEGQIIPGGTTWHRAPLVPGTGQPYHPGPLGPGGKPFPRGPLGPGGVPSRPPFKPPGR